MGLPMANARARLRETSHSGCAVNSIRQLHSSRPDRVNRLRLEANWLFPNCHLSTGTH